MPEEIRNNSIFREDFFPLEAALILEDISRQQDVSRLFTDVYESYPRTAQHMADVALFAGALLVDLNELEPVDTSLATATVTAALVHDIGKLHSDLRTLVDYPGKFSDEQRQSMGLHSVYGAEMVGATDIPGAPLISGIIRLHHADRQEVENYITEGQLSSEQAYQLRFGVMIVMVADVFEATMPIGAENSHASYGNRTASYREMEAEVYDPLEQKLPNLPDMSLVLAMAKMFSRARVAEYSVRQLTNRQLITA